MFPFRNFPVDVIIYEKRGNDYEFFRDRAARIHKKRTGEIYYELKKKKLQIPPVPYDHIYKVGNEKKTKNRIFLYSLTPYTFIPLKFGTDFGEILKNGTLPEQRILKEIIPKAIATIDVNDTKDPNLDMKLKVDDKWIYWAAQQLKQNVYRTQYKTTLQQILPIALVAVVGIVIGLVFYMSGGTLQVLANTNVQAANAMAEVADKFDHAMTTFAGAMAGQTPTAIPPEPPF